MAERYVIQTITREPSGKVVFLYSMAHDSERQRESLLILLDTWKEIIKKIEEGCPEGTIKLLVSDDQRAKQTVLYFLEEQILAPDIATQALDMLEISLRCKRARATEENRDCEGDKPGPQNRR